MTTDKVLAWIEECDSAEDLDAVLEACKSRRLDLNRDDHGYMPLGVDVAANPGVPPPRKKGKSKKGA